MWHCPPCCPSSQQKTLFLGLLPRVVVYPVGFSVPSSPQHLAPWDGSQQVYLSLPSTWSGTVGGSGPSVGCYGLCRFISPNRLAAWASCTTAAGRDALKLLLQWVRGCGWCSGSLCPLSDGASPCLSGIIDTAPRSPCPARSFGLALCLT